MTNRSVYGEYFCGNRISDYGIQNNRVDYGTLAKAFDAVLNNNIYGAAINAGYYWEPYCGSEYYYEDSHGNWYNEEEKEDKLNTLEEVKEELEDKKQYDPDNWNEKDEEALTDIIDDIEELSEEHYHDIFQYYIISDAGAELLKDYTDEIILYCEELDINLWCVTHYGTSWDYVLTDIKCNTGKYEEV